MCWMSIYIPIQPPSTPLSSFTNIFWARHVQLHKSWPRMCMIGLQDVIYIHHFFTLGLFGFCIFPVTLACYVSIMQVIVVAVTSMGWSGACYDMLYRAPRAVHATASFCPFAPIRSPILDLSSPFFTLYLTITSQSASLTHFTLTFVLSDC